MKLDYAVLGSSRVFNMVDIKSLDSTFNKKGINLGTSGSSYAENYVLLSEFLSKNNISELILNIDEFCFNSKNSYSYPFHEYEFLPLSDKYNDVFLDYIPKWKSYLWKALPLTKYIEFNHQFVLKPNNLLDKNMGSLLLNETDENEGFGNTKFETKRSQAKISEVDKKYFLKIIQLCNSKNIKVILITTPIYNYNHQSFFSSYIKSISQELNLRYYGFEGLMENNRIYFNDYTHTNKLGSIQYSINLGKKLKNNNE
ncbi:MAG TPA: hypothetical protein VNX01_01110 [Bacteroidia bacterium]|nr:hypothetical protein [Bacteroidia bacterium]